MATTTLARPTDYDAEAGQDLHNLMALMEALSMLDATRPVSTCCGCLKVDHGGAFGCIRCSCTARPITNRAYTT